MPRLETLQIMVTTGKRGPGSLPRYEINNFEIDFDESSGGNHPGETMELTGSPQSFPHSLALLGPEQGEWDIESLTATYFSGGESYSIRLGAITLDSETKLNLKYEKPPELLDV